MNIIAISNHNYDNTELFSIPNVQFITSREDLNIKTLSAVNPDYVFFPHWSYIIPAQIYEKFNCVIFHMTDLPFGRGGSPLQNLISRGIYNTKISAIKCGKVLDAGDIYLKKDFSLEEGSAKEIFQKAGFVMASMIQEIISTNPIPMPQKGKPVVFNRRTPQMSNISELTSLQKIYDYIRMLDADGYPKAYLDVGKIHFEFDTAKKISNDKLESKVTISITGDEW